MQRFALSVLAVAAGAVLALSQSAFKADNHNITRWGYVQSNGTFVNITGKTEDDSAHPASGTYSCIASANVCTGDDANTPMQVSDLSNTEAGNFRLNP